MGAQSAGEKLETRFEADMTLHLLGPDPVVLDGAEVTPPATPVVGRDLMLTVVLDRLTASDETGGAAEDAADTLGGGRRISARWRLDGVKGVAPDDVGGRDVWKIEATFRGVQTLSEVPSEGGHILRIEETVETPDRVLTARADAAADELPLSMIRGLGPNLANRLAADGLVRFADLARVPNTRIDAVAASVAADGTPVNSTLKLMHLILTMRRNIVLAGVNAGFLDERFAELPLSAVRNGAACSAPGEMPDVPKLRVEIMAQPLMPFLRAEDWDRITLEVEYLPINTVSSAGVTVVQGVNRKIEYTGILTADVSPLVTRLAIVVDNEVAGLGVLTADDRLLHRAAQTLSAGQAATTPDIAATLNETGGDAVTFNLISQSDCVVFVTGNLVRRRLAQGFAADVLRELAVGPWITASATPVAAASSEAQTVTLTGKLRKTGPRHMGLTESAAGDHQVVRAHARNRLVQPFQPLPGREEAPLSIGGVWLFVDAALDAETRLTVQIAPWDERHVRVGEPVARASATLAAELSPDVQGPDRLLAAWAPFEEAWVLDPDAQPLLHARELGEIDGPAGLVEAPLSHPRLSAARFRDISRSEVLATRGFGAEEKALLFDRGRDADTAGVVFTAGAASDTVEARAAAAAFTVTLPRADVTIRADAATEITALAARTATGLV